MIQERQPAGAEWASAAIRDDVVRVTRRRPKQWVVVHEVAHRLGIADEVAADAVKSAVDKGWLVADGNPPHSVRLPTSLTRQQNPLQELT
jgi:hypothetical protein